MSHQESFSRRQLLKAAAGGAILTVPLFRERGRVNAQEDQTSQTTETAIVIPEFETLPDQIQGFTALVTENMRPDALSSLGLAPILTEEALTKQYESGAFITYKENPIPEKPDFVFLEYSLELPNAEDPFGSWYVYDDVKRNALWENIVFVSNATQGLREKGDSAPVAYDDLQPNAEFFFNLPANGMIWKDFSELAPEAEKDKYKGIGIIGQWENDTPLVEGIIFQLEISGVVGYTYFKAEPQTAQAIQIAQQKLTSGLAMTHQLREIGLERMSARLNTPHVNVSLQ